MKLFYWPMSHNARKVRMLAQHLELPVEEVAISMQEKEHKAPEFLAINPMGQVPVIQDGDYAVWQANGALIYLAAQSENDLLGQSAREWGHITQWLVWQSAELSGPVTALHVENYFKRVQNAPVDAKKKASAIARLNELLTILEVSLSETGYLVGSRLTVADFAMIGDFSHARNAQFPLDDYPNISAWLDAFESMPVWSSTMPPQIG